MNLTGKLECIFCEKCGERIGWMEAAARLPDGILCDSCRDGYSWNED